MRAKTFAALCAGLGAVAAAVAILQYFRLQPAEPTNPDDLRVRYYRLEGATADLLVRGLLADDLKEALGGPQEVMDNEVLETAREVLSRFQRPIAAESVYITNATDEPAERSFEDFSAEAGRRDPTEWQAYLGGDRRNYQFFVPDLRAFEEFPHAQNVPAGYEIYHEQASSGHQLNQQTLPVIWRWLREDDLTNYRSNAQAFAQRFLREEYQEGILANAFEGSPELIAGLQYLARDGLPSGFILIEGRPTAHGGWTIDASLRDFELEVAVFQNVGDRPIQVSGLRYRTSGTDSLREASSTDASLDRAASSSTQLTAARTIAPGESVIVPLRITFSYGERDRPSVLESPSYPPSAVGADLVDVAITYGWTVRKSRSDMMRSALPEPPERFDFGPTWRLETVTIQNNEVPVRQADWQHMALHFGYPAGSCPFVLTRTDSAHPWINEGHVLLGATRSQLERTDTEELDRFDGHLVLRELEDEVAFIGDIRILVLNRQGQREYLYPSARPSEGWVVGPHSQVELYFPRYRPSDHRHPVAEVRGYYRPFALFGGELVASTERN